MHVYSFKNLVEASRQRSTIESLLVFPCATPHMQQNWKSETTEKKCY